VIDHNIVIDELIRVGAVKVIMSSYDESWLLRNHINNELRRQGLKESYTSAVMNTTLIIWSIEMYGKKGSKHLVADMLEVFKLLPLSALEPKANIGDPDLERVFKELKKEAKQTGEKRIKDMIGKLGK